MMDTAELNPALFIFTGMVLSVVTVVLIHYVFLVFSLWSLAIGCFVGFYLLKSFEEIPSLYVLLQLSGLVRTKKVSAYNEREKKTKGCGICSKKGCKRHKFDQSEMIKSLENLVLPQTVDDALTELFEIMLSTHVYAWYRDLSRDQGFVDEIRYALHQSVSIIYQRLQKVQLPQFLIKCMLRKLLVHIDSFFFVKEQLTNKDRLQQLVLEHLKTYKHFCVQNETAEKEYLRYTIQTLLPHLLPKIPLSSKALNFFLEELSVNILLGPLVEKITEPDFVNNILLIFLDEEVIPEPNYPLSASVPFLKNFGKKRADYSHTSLQIPAYELIHDAVYLYPFMQFMKQEGALNVLQFCLSVEEFNKRILAGAELNKKEEAQILEEIKEVNDLYFKDDGVDKINFPKELTREFQSCISSMENQLDHAAVAAPLFLAYEHAVNILEKIYVPLFHSSAEMFLLQCGSRKIEVKKTAEEMNYSKKKFMPFGDLSKITSKIRSRKLRAKDGEELSLMDELDYPCEEGFEAYESGDEEDDSEDVDEYHCDSIDLNYCHVAIPRMDFVLIEGKRCYVYVLTIEQIGEQSQWQVIRKYNEFYVLDSKLRRFHETLNIAELPPKRTILKKDFDYLNSIRPKLQEYLQRLARSPALQKSSLVQSFLTPGHDGIDGMFEPDSVRHEAGRKVKSLRSKLVTEKGQNLSVFLNSFISSAEPAAKKKIPPKAFTSTMYSNHRRHDSLISLPPPYWARELRRSLSTIADPLRHSVSEFLLYTCRNFFKIPSWVHHLLVFLQFTCKNTIDVFVDKFITYKLTNTLAERQVVSYIHLVRDVIFFNNDPPRTDSEKAERRDAVLAQLLTFLPRLGRDMVRVENHDYAMRTILEMFQYPLLNKHLFYVLFDEIVYELFPEVKTSSEDKT